MSESTSSARSTVATAARRAHADGGIWDSVREALRGSHRDYTEGPVSRAILILAIPMVLEMIMESVFAVCDVFFVSKLGATAVAAVGLTESWLTLIYAVAMGLAISASAMVARRTGERDREGAAQAAGQAILLALAMALVLGVAGGVAGAAICSASWARRPTCIATGTLVHARHARRQRHDHHAVRDQRDFPRRGRRGDRHARALAGERDQHSARAVSDLWTRTVPATGVTGAAVATTIGRGTGALFALSRLLKPGSRIDIHPRHLRLDLALIGRMVRIGWSAAVQMLIGMGSWIALIRILSTFGSNVLAGYTIGIRLYHLRAAAGGRRGERRRDDGRAGARREEAGARRACGEDGGNVQHDRAQRGRRRARAARADRSLGCSRTIRSSCRSRRMRFASSRADFPSMRGEW